MKIGIGPYYLSRYGFKEGGERMRAHGFEYLDFDWYANTENELYANTGDAFIEDCKAWREKLTSGGVKINQIHGPWRCPVCDGTEEDRAERFEKMSRALIAAGVLGARYMAIHPIMPFGADSPDNPEELRRLNLEFYSALAEVAKENGVIICLENMPFTKFPLASVEATLGLVKELAHPNVRMCLDTGHANIFSPAIGDAVRLIGKEYLRILHVHDNMRDNDRHLLPFEGTADWDDFAKALADIGFEGVVSLETSVQRFVDNEENREAMEIDLAERVKKVARYL